MRMYFQHCIKTQTSLVICLNNSLTNHQYSVVGIFLPIFREKGKNMEYVNQKEVDELNEKLKKIDILQSYDKDMNSISNQ